MDALAIHLSKIASKFPDRRIYGADVVQSDPGWHSHASWINARPDAQVPVLVSSYHIEESGDPKCTWGDEIIALATDGSDKVWRFAHSRSTVHNCSPNPAESKGYNFWDCPRGNVSQDGRFFMFTSNWEEALGKDTQGRFREDAFIVKLEIQGADK